MTRYALGYWLGLGFGLGPGQGLDLKSGYKGGKVMSHDYSMAM